MLLSYMCLHFLSSEILEVNIVFCSCTHHGIFAISSSKFFF